MTKIITAVIIIAVLYGGWHLFLYWEKVKNEEEVQKKELAQQAVRRGATVALFTDQWLSPISRVARYVLPARVTVPSMWDSTAGLLLLVEALLSAIATELGPTARNRLRAVERMR